VDPTRDRRIALAIDAMEQHLSARLTVPDLAAAVDLSPSRFAHVFRCTMGVSPLRYVHDLRMRRAQQLLADTSLPVHEVRRQVGWRDPSHFSKAFRRRFGVGPRRYRRLCAAAANAARDECA
jgi:AraC family transcriptional regulator of arabinose operon